MADFKTRIDDLTGFASTDDVAIVDWLTAGAKEIIDVLPMSKLERMSEVEEFTGNTPVEDKKILDVLRKDENNSNILMPCREIDARQSGRAVDSNYMEFATSSDPVYYLENKRLYTLPASAATDDSKLVKINEDFTVDITQDSISNFPGEATNAVVLYASRNAIVRLMNLKHSSVSALNVSDLSISATAPVSPAITTVSYSAATNADASSTTQSTVSLGVTPAKIDVDTSAPTYTKPSLTLTTLGLPDLNISASAPADITVGSASVSFSQAVPQFIPPVLTVDMNQFETFLETDEDTELAQLQLGRLNNEVSQYQSNIQNEIANFNESVESYRAELQKSIKDAELTSAKEAQEIQEYSNDIQKYSQNVQKEVQAYQQSTQKELSIYSTKVRADIDKFRADIQNELNEFNKENVKYQASIQGEVQKHNSDLQSNIEQARIDLAKAQQDARQATQVDIANKAQDQALALQNAIQTMQSIIADNSNELSKFSQDIDSYKTDVSKEVQEYSVNLQQKVQEFQSALQIATVEYSWYEKQYAMINAQFVEALRLIGVDKLEIEKQREGR
jgi:hypothetical protein